MRYWALFSLLVHLFFFFGLKRVIEQQPAQPIGEILNKNISMEVHVEKVSESPKPLEKKRIVQSQPAEPVKSPPKNAFFGEKNQSTDRETVHRDRSIQMGLAPNQKPIPQTSPSKESLLTKEKIAEPTLKTSPYQLGLPLFSEIKPLNPQASPQEAQDYIPGYKLSDRTVLNTREFVYYSYYQRIRERLDRAWVPILKNQLAKYYRTGRHLASDMDHTTRVMVVLNKGGEIIRVKILYESGTRDLDEAAVKAFNHAGPFPNPPKGIVDSNGEIQIPWEFILRT